MTKILNKSELSCFDNMDEYGCNFKEVLDFNQYILNLPKYNELSCEHIDLISRTNRILIESKNNLITIIDYLSDKSIDRIDLLINEITPLTSNYLNSLEDDYEINLLNMAIQAKKQIKQIKSDLDKNVLAERIKHKKTKDQLNDFKKAKSKGGSYSPYKENEKNILILLNLYRENQSSLIYKQTHQELAQKIELRINKKVVLSTVKKWWANYKKSNGTTIFKKDNN